MRLTAQARVYLQAGEEVFRKPSFWDKIKTFAGSDVDLRTGELSVAGNALAMCEQVQQAFKLAKVTNAVSLTMDREILYQDLEDRPDDADLLITAARRSQTMFAQPFEATVRAKYKKNEPAVLIAIGGRITSLRPLDGEDQEVAKDRIGKALGDQNLVPAAKAMLDALLAQLETGLSRVFVGARIDSDHADIQVVKPSRDELQQMHSGFDDRHAALRDQPVYSSGWSYGSYYDPWSRYYRDPMDTFVNLMVLDAIMHPRPMWGYGPGYLGSSWSSYGAPVTVINYNGHAYGNADHIQSFQGQLGDVGQVSNLDWSSASWDDSQLSGYDANASSFDQYSGGAAAGGSWDCAGGAESSSAGSSSDCSFDCSADCAADCASSDCSWDCSSDCSSDCGGGGSDW